MTEEFDIIQKAQHYNSHKSGIEAIDICRHLTGDWFNAFKYVFRADHKNGRQDIEKALYYAKDAVKHCLPIHSESWGPDQQELLFCVMDHEAYGDRFAFYNAIALESPSSALQCVERILDAWPTDE